MVFALTMSSTRALRFAHTFADVGERAAGGAADPADRWLRRLAAGLEIRKPGAEFRELRRRELQDRFFDLFGSHARRLAGQARSLKAQ